MTDVAWGAFAPKGMSRLVLDTTLRLPRSWAGKRLFYTLRRFGRSVLAGKPVDVVRFGTRLRLSSDRNNVCEGRILFNPDYFDSSERAFLNEVLPPEPVFIDAGANIGGYSFFVTQIRPKARVIAVEAQANTYRRLAFNVAQNAGRQITPVHCALSDKNGTVDLFINDTNNGETSIKLRNESGRSVRVKGLTLLQLAEDFDLPRIDAMKMDIEGAEDFVLKAFLEAAPEALYPRVILMEHSGKRWDFDLVGLLEGYCYRKTRDFGGNIVLSRD